MLDARNDRLDYGELLSPPEGYQLERAVGTTYSVDLETLMILPVALFHSQPLDGDLKTLRYDMFHSISEAASRITVFCQEGKIKVPKSYHTLMAYWEKGLCEVRMESHACSFHPKVWIVRYEAQGLPAKYRVLVLSRNLTSSRDWDLAFCTSGHVGRQKRGGNDALVHFLEYLDRSRVRRSCAQEMDRLFLDELKKVNFDLPDGFASLVFHPIGVPVGNTSKVYVNPLKVRTWNELLVLSPFVDKTTIMSLRKKTARLHLLSRGDKMAALPASALAEVDCWQLAPRLRDAELELELDERGLEPLKQDLHAKAYVGKAGKKEYTWFLGSANSTDPAYSGRNIEFMVELRSSASSFGPIRVLKCLKDPISKGQALFEYFKHPGGTDAGVEKAFDDALRKLVFQITGLSFTGMAQQLGDADCYDLSISVDASRLEIPKGFTAAFKPVQEERRKAEPLRCADMCVDRFTRYREIELSPFLQVEVAHTSGRARSFLVRMEIELPQSRLRKILAFHIDDREKFLDYVCFLLGNIETGIIGKKGKGGGGGEISERKVPVMPVYEILLAAASRDPQRLDAVAQTMSSLAGEGNGTVISPEFQRMWQVFEAYVENGRRDGK